MGALATAAAPAIFSTSKAYAQSPNEMMRMAAIGVGRQGRGDMQEMIYQGLDYNARVVAVCDVDANRMTQGRQLVEKIYKEQADKVGTYDGCDTYTDYRKLLERKDIDGVLIVTPDHQHAPIAVAAAKAGKDIYLEKPMTYTIREGRQLVEAVRSNDRIFQVGSQQRSSVYFRKACELVRNGRIGNLHTIIVELPPDSGTGDTTEAPIPENLSYDLWLGPAPDVPYIESRVHPQNGFSRPGWLQVGQYCHGMITGWGAHMNDIAQWGNGSDDTTIIEIEATAEYPERGTFNVHTQYQAEGKYANGVKLIQKTGGGSVRFEGDEGWVMVSRGKLTASKPELLKEKNDNYEIKLYESKNHMADFLNAMRTRKDPICTVEIGHHSNTICVMTHIAMKNEGKLLWDPKAERFTNNDKANEMLDYDHREPWVIA